MDKIHKKTKTTALFLCLEKIVFRATARILSELFKKKFCYRTMMQWGEKENKKQESKKYRLKEEIKVLEMSNFSLVFFAFHATSLLFFYSIHA